MRAGSGVEYDPKVGIGASAIAGAGRTATSSAWAVGSPARGAEAADVHQSPLGRCCTRAYVGRGRGGRAGGRVRQAEGVCEEVQGRGQLGEQREGEVAEAGLGEGGGGRDGAGGGGEGSEMGDGGGESGERGGCGEEGAEGELGGGVVVWGGEDAVEEAVGVGGLEDGEDGACVEERWGRVCALLLVGGRGAF